MSIQLNDDTVTFDFFLKRDTPEFVARDFAEQFKLDHDNFNKFKNEVQRHLQKYKEHRKK